MQLLTFMLGDEEYAVATEHVQEIRAYEPPSSIAGLPRSFAGLLNLRGSILPIVDLRKKLDVAAAAITALTATIVLFARGRVVGAVVDSVCEVLSVDADAIVQPQLLADHGLRYVIGIVPIGERLVIVIDFNTLVESDDFGMLEEATLRAALDQHALNSKEIQ